jgi:hypothetical protein
MLKILQRSLDQYLSGLKFVVFASFVLWSIVICMFIGKKFYCDICGFAKYKKRGYKLILMHLSIMYLTITESGNIMEPYYFWIHNIDIRSTSGLPKAEIFGRSRRFSLFGFWLRPPKFYSKCSAFGFVLKMSCS